MESARREALQFILVFSKICKIYFFYQHSTFISVEFTVIRIHIRYIYQDSYSHCSHLHRSHEELGIITICKGIEDESLIGNVNTFLYLQYSSSMKNVLKRQV